MTLGRLSNMKAGFRHMAALFAVVCAIGCTAGSATKASNSLDAEPTVQVGVTESEISPAASLFVTAFRYDSAKNELVWGEEWTDWSNGTVSPPTWYQVITLTNGERKVRTTPIEARDFEDWTSLFVYGYKVTGGKKYFYDRTTDELSIVEYSAGDDPSSMELDYLDGEAAIFTEYLGGVSHRLWRVSVDTDGIKTKDVLVERIDMVTANMSSSGPGLISMSADGEVCAWSATTPHHDRISWKAEGKIHTYMNDTLIEHATLSLSGKHLYILESNEKHLVSAIDTTTGMKVLLKEYPMHEWPYHYILLDRDASSDLLVVYRADTFEVEILSPEGRVKEVFKLHPNAKVAISNP